MMQEQGQDLSDADLWEQLVKSGKTPQMATALVLQRQKGFAGKGTSRSWEPAPEPKVNPVEGMARAANQGLTFGLSDEISAGLGATLDKAKGKPFGASYSERVQGERGLDRQFKGDHPVLGYGAEIAGGIANAGAIPQLAKMGAVKGGALVGAAYGAGASEGGLASRGAGAVQGGIVGGVGGAAIEGVTRAASPMMRALAGKLSPNSTVGRALAKRGMAVGPEQAAASDAERDILKQIQRAGLTPDAVAQSATGAHPDAMLLDVGGESMLRRARGVHAIPSKGSATIDATLRERVAGQPGRVQSKVAGAITGKPRENAVQTAQQLVDMRRQAAKPLYEQAYGHGAIQNPEITRHVEELRKFPAFDAAWRRGLMNDALESADPSLPEWAREAVPDWKGTATGKPSGTARLNSGGLRTPSQMADDELLGEIERLSAGRDMDQALVDAIPGRDLDEARGLRSLGMTEDAEGLVRGDVRSSTSMSQNRANQRQKSLDKLYAEAEKRGLFKGNASEWADDAADEIVPDGPQGITLRQLDAWKKGLDATIEIGRGSTNALSRNEARIYRQRLEDVLKMADEEVPAYGQAREQFAGDSRLMEAHEIGQAFRRMDRDELAEALGSMSAGEKELVRRGVLSDLSTELAKVTDGRDVTRIFQNPLMREKLGMLLPDEQTAHRFMADLAEESRLHKNAQTVLSGSPTARIEAEKADDVGGSVARGAVDMMTGNVRGPLVAALRRIMGPQEVRGLTEAKADALAPMLTAKGEKMQALIRELERKARMQKAGGGKRSGAASALVRPLAIGSGRQQ